MIPFNRPFISGNEINYIQDAQNRCQLSGDGFYTKLCHEWLEQHFNCPKALLTHSCTAALELSALLIDIEPGDEVIMPSFTFVSTANSFVLRGAKPIFVDIDPITFNIDPTQIIKAISPKTKAIVVVHYAGVACDMDEIVNIASENHIFLIEDAAQALLSSYKGKPLGSFGDLACFSFHETKNINCGEGGALIINNQKLSERAEILREKGTNRSHFLRGAVDKYTWVDKGSSFLPSELNAAFLYAQLELSHDITQRRLCIWNKYHDSLLNNPHLEKLGIVLPSPPPSCLHNAHIFYLLFPLKDCRDQFIDLMKLEGVNVTFHYIPLHSSPAGQLYSSSVGTLSITNFVSSCLVRLPIYVGVDVENVLKKVENVMLKMC